MAPVLSQYIVRDGITALSGSHVGVFSMSDRYSCSGRAVCSGREILLDGRTDCRHCFLLACFHSY